MADEAALDFETFDPNFERNLKQNTALYNRTFCAWNKSVDGIDFILFPFKKLPQVTLRLVTTMLISCSHQHQGKATIMSY